MAALQRAKSSVCVAALLVGLVCHAAEPPSAQWSGDDYQNLTVRQHRTCVENEQYLHQGLCCLNCQAGKETTLEGYTVDSAAPVTCN
ncbi:hypothetical protein F7725_015877 [Dissostichus mawsoni]|uniref:Uncharacterized protein n=1 Tax=Dissostichus mawsoni TaxID=36200 RepID=A0A7J5YJ61_DISMA|nr:hypothetical protein F7725_015877 [Dissostichus mawsoni]